MQQHSTKVTKLSKPHSFSQYNYLDLRRHMYDTWEHKCILLLLIFHCIHIHLYNLHSINHIFTTQISLLR